MGSKRLKAIVLQGSGRMKIADADGMKAYSKAFATKIKEANLPKFFKGFLFPFMGLLMAKQKSVSPMDGIFAAMVNKKWGTCPINTLGMTNGDSPVKNWGGSVVDFKKKQYKKLNPDYVIARETKKYGCSSCVVSCGGICDIKDVRDGKFSHTHKPEYETCQSFGALLLHNDLDTIFYLNEILNRAGMDTISAGNTVAFAMECFENGILTEKDTDGLILKWGDSEAILALLDKMIHREGIGDILADGVKLAAERIGKGAEKFAVHVGGQEPGMHDPKMDPLLGIHFSDPTPGRHTTGGAVYYNSMRLWDEVSWAPEVKKYPKSEAYTPSDKEALKAVATTAYKMLTDGAGGCFFGMILGLDHWNLFTMLNLATGWNLNADAYMEIGMRIQTLRQLFNIKHGIKPKNYIPQGRVIGNPPLSGGALKGITVSIEEMVQLYWKHFKWDEKTGVPKDDILDEIGLMELLN